MTQQRQSGLLLLRFCIVSVSIGTALIWSNVIPSLSFLGLALVGLAAGPIFPSLIATTPQRLGIAHTANGIGFHIAAAALGQSLLPTFVGVLANRMSLEIVGPFLFVAAVLLFITHALLIVVSDRETLFQTEAELIAKPTS
jgi:hypothetical protein